MNSSNSTNSINRIFDISIGIMAYNEESNIEQLLQALLAQKLLTTQLKEIYVVASGCTDRTEDIVRKYAEKDARIRLLSQQRREGKIKKLL